MKLKKFKEKDGKRIGIIVFTITCILLVCGAVLYRTFAIFEVRTNQNVIKGTVQDPGNLYFAFYQKNEESGEYVIQKEMPNLEDGYVLDEVQSYCGVNGEKDKDIEVYLSEDGYIKVKGMTTSRTKCNLYFAKGIFIKEKGIPVVTSGDGLYKVEHPANETEGMDDGWQKEEYRYAGKNPNNYVSFNDEPWRIIGLVNVKVTKEDGSEGIEQRLKIIKDISLGAFVWNKEKINDWTLSSLMEMLNDYYYNSVNNFKCYTSTNNMDVITVEEKDCDFSNNGLKKEAQIMLDDNIIWNIGGSKSYTDVTVSIFYNRERGTVTANGNANPSTWLKDKKTNDEAYHSIALPYPSDYVYASNGGKFGRDACFKRNLFYWRDDDGEYKTQCANTDWLKPNEGYVWLLTPFADQPYHAFRSNFEGFVGVTDVDNSSAVHPTLYLKSNVKIIGGTGTADDMFILSVK